MQSNGATLVQKCGEMFRQFHDMTAADIPLAKLGVSFFQKSDIPGLGGHCFLEIYDLASRDRLGLVTDNDLPIGLPAPLSLFEPLRDALSDMNVGEIAIDRAVVRQRAAALAA